MSSTHRAFQSDFNFHHQPILSRESGEYCLSHPTLRIITGSDETDSKPSPVKPVNNKAYSYYTEGNQFFKKADYAQAEVQYRLSVELLCPTDRSFQALEIKFCHATTLYLLHRNEEALSVLMPIRTELQNNSNITTDKLEQQEILNLQATSKLLQHGIYYELGNKYLEKKEYKLAEENLRQAINLMDPMDDSMDPITVKYAYAECLCELGDYSEATYLVEEIEYQLQTVDLNPDEYEKWHTHTSLLLKRIEDHIKMQKNLKPAVATRHFRPGLFFGSNVSSHAASSSSNSAIQNTSQPKIEDQIDINKLSITSHTPH